MVSSSTRQASQAHNSFTVVYSTDDRYAWLAGISIESLLQNHRETETLSVVVLAIGISANNRQKLLSTAGRYGRQLCFLDVASQLEQLNRLEISLPAPFSVYARLFIANLLPDFSGRILYLDCDTLVCGDLHDLVFMSMQNRPIAMALDCVRNEYKRVIGLPEDAPYYNSGVLLVDLKRWRENNCKDRIIDHMVNIQACYPLYDQDILNIVLKDDIVRIPARFNLLSQMLLHHHAELKKVYGLKESYWLTEGELETAKKNTAIFHFSGNTFVRPWFANSKHPLALEYQTRIRTSEWGETELGFYRLPLPYRIQFLGYRHLPSQVFAILSKIMQRLFIKLTYKI